VLGDRRAVDHDIGAVNVLGGVAFVDDRAEAGEPVGDRRAPQVRPGDAVAQVEQDLGDPAHADAADADEVQAAALYDFLVEQQDYFRPFAER